MPSLCLSLSIDAIINFQKQLKPIDAIINFQKHIKNQYVFLFFRTELKSKWRHKLHNTDNKGQTKCRINQAQKIIRDRMELKPLKSRRYAIPEKPSKTRNQSRGRRLVAETCRGWAIALADLLRAGGWAAMSRSSATSRRKLSAIVEGWKRRLYVVCRIKLILYY